MLKDPAAFRPLGESARHTVEGTYWIHVTLPKIKASFEQVVASGPRDPSVRAGRLVRPAPAANPAGRAVFAG